MSDNKSKLDVDEDVNSSVSGSNSEVDKVGEATEALLELQDKHFPWSKNHKFF